MMFNHWPSFRLSLREAFAALSDKLLELHFRDPDLPTQVHRW
jgi:hypothetical protein